MLLMVVVCPLFDSDQHELNDTACGCGCQVQFVEGEMLLIHNQFNSEITTDWGIFDLNFEVVE